MIYAYDKNYLEKARTSLGRMLDFATYDLKFELSDFYDLFLNSNLSKRFEDGDFTILVGKSGIELAYEVLEQSSIPYKRIRPQYTINRSEEYWAGWVLAYYQWKTSLSFSTINQFISIQEIVALYSPYHEMDIQHVCDKLDELYKNSNLVTNLKRLRQKAGLSQKQLSELSEIPLRTIQQYEQRQKLINKAQAIYLVNLSQVLYCEVDDLLEKIQ